MDEKNEVCSNCVHCHLTKQLVGVKGDRKWVGSYICTLWLDLKETKEPLLLTLGNEVDRPNIDLCECFTLKECEKNEMQKMQQ